MVNSLTNIYLGNQSWVSMGWTSEDMHLSKDRIFVDVAD